VQPASILGLYIGKCPSLSGGGVSAIVVYLRGKVRKRIREKKGIYERTKREKIKGKLKVKIAK
jgi:hypothetical protein